MRWIWDHSKLIRNVFIVLFGLFAVGAVWMLLGAAAPAKILALTVLSGLMAVISSIITILYVAPALENESRFETQLAGALLLAGIVMMIGGTIGVLLS